MHDSSIALALSLLAGLPPDATADATTAIPKGDIDGNELAASTDLQPRQ